MLISFLIYLIIYFICFTDGGWAEWGAWSACSVSCGHGYKKRYRVCYDVDIGGEGQGCKGQDNQLAACYQQCPDSSKSYYSHV